MTNGTGPNRTDGREAPTREGGAEVKAEASHGGETAMVGSREMEERKWRGGDSIALHSTAKQSKEPLGRVEHISW